MPEEHYDIDPPKRAEKFFEWYCNDRLERDYRSGISMKDL
jgi:hypothetical protein